MASYNESLLFLLFFLFSCFLLISLRSSLAFHSIYPAYVLGSFLTPISWGLHVAAWIQKQNESAKK